MSAVAPARLDGRGPAARGAAADAGRGAGRDGRGQRLRLRADRLRARAGRPDRAAPAPRRWPSPHGVPGARPGRRGTSRRWCSGRSTRRRRASSRRTSTPPSRPRRWWRAARYPPHGRARLRDLRAGPAGTASSTAEAAPTRGRADAGVRDDRVARRGRPSAPTSLATAGLDGIMIGTADLAHLQRTATTPTRPTPSPRCTAPWPTPAPCGWTSSTRAGRPPRAFADGAQLVVYNLTATLMATWPTSAPPSLTRPPSRAWLCASSRRATHPRVSARASGGGGRLRPRVLERGQVRAGVEDDELGTGDQRGRSPRAGPGRTTGRRRAAMTRVGQRDRARAPAARRPGSPAARSCASSVAAPTSSAIPRASSTRSGRLGDHGGRAAGRQQLRLQLAGRARRPAPPAARLQAACWPRSGAYGLVDIRQSRVDALGRPADQGHRDDRAQGQPGQGEPVRQHVEQPVHLTVHRRLRAATGRERGESGRSSTDHSAAEQFMPGSSTSGSCRLSDGHPLTAPGAEAGDQVLLGDERDRDHRQGEQHGRGRRPAAAWAGSARAGWR